MDKIQQAKELAKAYHKGQMYGDEDYFEGHIKKVASAVVNRDTIYPKERNFSIEDALCVAYLHDILEDTDMSPEALYVIFGIEIYNAVVTLTKRDNEEYDEYIHRVLQNDMAAYVKKCDALTNFLKSMQTNDQRRIKKYSKVLEVLDDV